MASAIPHLEALRLRSSASVSMGSAVVPEEMFRAKQMAALILCGPSLNHVITDHHTVDAPTQDGVSSACLSDSFCYTSLPPRAVRPRLENARGVCCRRKPSAKFGWETS